MPSIAKPTPARPPLAPLALALALAALPALATRSALAQSPIMPGDPATRTAPVGAGGAATSAATGATPGAGGAAPADAAPRRRTRAGSPERAAKSKECSAQADAQNLHGKARKTFRGTCMRG